MPDRPLSPRLQHADLGRQRPRPRADLRDDQGRRLGGRRAPRQRRQLERAAVARAGDAGARRSAGDRDARRGPDRRRAARADHRDAEADDRLRGGARLRGVRLHRWRPDRPAAPDRRRVQAPRRRRRGPHRACGAVRHDRQPPLASALHRRTRDRTGPPAGARRPAPQGLPRRRHLRLHGRGLPRPDPPLCPRTGYVHLKDWAFGKYCILGQGTKGIDWSRGPGDLHGDRVRRLGHRRAVVVRRHGRGRELRREP